MGGDSTTAVAADAAGDVYTAGTFSGTVTPAGSATPLTSAGGTDVYVAKYARSGMFLWAARLGEAGNDDARGIAVDAAGGNVYVVGQSGAAGYLAGFDASTGAAAWTNSGLGTWTAAVAVDAGGSVYSAGPVGSGTSRLTKHDAAGTQQWQATLTGVHSWSLAAAAGAVYVGGLYGPTATITTASGTTALAGSSFSCGYVAKLSADNQLAWATTFQGAKDRRGNPQGFVTTVRVAADPAGNVYAAGSFLGTVNFGNSSAGAGPFVLAGSGNGSAYVTKLTTGGTMSWAKMFGSASVGNKPKGGVTGYAEVYSVATDAAGAVYLTGSFYGGPTSFNPAGGGTLTPAGGEDIFVSKLSAAGAFQWAVRAGGSGVERGYGIAVNGFGDIYVAGAIGQGTADFDSGTTWLDDRDLLTGPTGFLWQITQP